MIVFCHLLNDNSGSPIILRQAIRALKCADNACMLLIGSQGRGCLEAAGVPITRYWYRRSRFRIVTLCTYFISQILLYRALSRAHLPLDVVIYVNTLLPFGAALWGWRNGRAVLYHVHEVSISPSLLRGFLVRMVQKTAHRTLYVSEDNRSRLPIPAVPSAVLPNPVAPEIAEAGFARPYFPRRSGSFEALMLASPRDFKGVPEYLGLAKRFQNRRDIRFTLVLNGDAAEVAQYLPDGTVPKNVTIHSRTETPAQFYATADVLLNLSRVDMWIETFGLTIVEGMAFGLPVIAPPVGGPAEILVHGREGYLIDSRDGDRLETALASLAESPETALKMSAAARSRSRDFTAERFAESLRQQIQMLRPHEKTA